MLPPAGDGTAFVPLAGTLEDILCIREERGVAADNTVRYTKNVLQIPADRHRHHDVKARVRVHEYPDGRIAVLHGPRRRATCGPDGKQMNAPEQAA